MLVYLTWSWHGSKLLGVANTKDMVIMSRQTLLVCYSKGWVWTQVASSVRFHPPALRLRPGQVKKLWPFSPQSCPVQNIPLLFPKKPYAWNSQAFASPQTVLKLEMWVLAIGTTAMVHQRDLFQSTPGISGITGFAGGTQPSLVSLVSCSLTAGSTSDCGWLWGVAYVRETWKPWFCFTLLSYGLMTWWHGRKAIHRLWPVVHLPSMSSSSSSSSSWSSSLSSFFIIIIPMVLVILVSTHNRWCYGPPQMQATLALPAVRQHRPHAHRPQVFH